MCSCNLFMALTLVGIHLTNGEPDDTTTTSFSDRRWPYPILPGNFEMLLHSLQNVTMMTSGTAESDKVGGNLLHTYPLPDHQKKENIMMMVSVYDDILQMQNILTLQMYSTIGNNWRFHNSEPVNGIIPWTSSLNSTAFNKSQVNKAFMSLLNDLKQTDQEYYPYDVTTNILRRGDSVSFIQGSPEGDEIFLIYFLKDVWPVNYYGELLLYEQEEIVTAVKPAFNRAVLWNSSLGYITKPPSMNCMESLYFLMVKYTTNKEKVKTFEENRLRYEQKMKRSQEELFQSMEELGSYYSELNVSEHLIKNYTGTYGNKMFLFDDLFLEEDLAKLRNHVESHGLFFFDDSHDADSDNVQWISGFKISLFTQSRLWSVIQSVAQLVSGSSDWFPYDISCNNIRSFDSTQNHQDCEMWEEEWTFLLYLTPNLTLDNGGETAYYTNTEDNEYITSVRPKYGRAVIFEGIIPHSARPPSSAHSGPRFTFAVKVSMNPMIAWGKALKQEYAHEEYLHSAGLTILKKYYHDQLDLLDKGDLVDVAHEDANGSCEKEGGHCTENFKPTRYRAGQGMELNERLADIVRKDHDVDDEDLTVLYDHMEDSFINTEDFPEVMERNLFIYQMAHEAKSDAKAFREVVIQALKDADEMKRRYMQLLQIVL